MDPLRHLDLLVLLLALPVFVLLDAPLAGYLAAGAAWIVGRIATDAAARRRDAALASGDRTTALRVVAFSTLGRVWLLAGAILAVGLIDEREAGLAAAVLAFVLVTVSFVVQYLEHGGARAEVAR
jgi:hypothetical protein